MVVCLGVVEMKFLRADHAHYNVEDAELARGEGADHNAASGEARRAQLDEACGAGHAVALLSAASPRERLRAHRQGPRCGSRHCPPGTTRQGRPPRALATAHFWSARRQSALPVSEAMLARRDIMEPEPPAPALLILERSESAGCEMMAATTPESAEGLG